MHTFRFNQRLQLMKHKAGLILLLLLAPILGISQGDMPANPFITHMFTADPSAHVWDDGRLYLYPSHDIAPPQGADRMDEYHVFSTDNMVDWVDHGEILSSDDVSWGRPEGGFMWAPDCAYKDGTYYFYFPHPSGAEWNSTWKIGVATSSNPASNFTVQGYIPGLESLIDPCIFTDDDGEVYFYYGGGGVCKGGKLKDNMMEIDGQLQNMQGLVDFHEATWVHKYNGKYYLSYSDNHDSGDEHNRMRYAISDSPLGPWTHQGIFMEPTNSYTNHGSIVAYKDQWYFFYHNSALSGHDWLRSVCVEKLFYNEDGTIQLVEQTKGHGTPYGGTPWPIPGLIEAEDYDEGGQAISYSDSDTINNGGQYRPDEFVDVEVCGEGGYNVGFISGSEWLEYTVNVASTGTYTLELRVASLTDGGSSLRIDFNGIDKTGSMAVLNTGGWQTYTTISKDIELEAGEQIMTLKMGDGAFNINYINVKHPEEPQEPEEVLASQPEYGLQMFPNPTSERFTVRYEKVIVENATFQLYDLSGNLVRRGTLLTGETEVSVEGIRPGTYILNVRASGSLLFTKKMVIQ